MVLAHSCRLCRAFGQRLRSRLHSVLSLVGKPVRFKLIRSWAVVWKLVFFVFRLKSSHHLLHSEHHISLFSQLLLILRVSIVFSHSDKFFNQHFKNVISVLKFESSNLLKVSYLYDVWILFDCLFLLLSGLKLLSLLDDHFLLLGNQLVLRWSLLLKLFSLELDRVLNKPECLGFVVMLNSCSFCQYGSFWRSNSFAFVNHRRRTVGLRKHCS